MEENQINEPFNEPSPVDFHVVIRVIPETSAYSVTIGEIQDGRFIQTSRRPNCCDCDWEVAKPNPLAPGQSYVLSTDLHVLISEIMIYSKDVMLYPNMLVFSIKDYAYQYESTEKENEE